MKVRIIKKPISSYFVNAEKWDNDILSCEDYCKNLCDQFDIFEMIPITYNEKITGYRIEHKNKECQIMSYEVWYYNELHSSKPGWRQYLWSEYHDRSYDDCVLTIKEAIDKARECKIKYEKNYGIIVDEFNI